MSDRYFLAPNNSGPWREVMKRDFIEAEKSNGFKSKFGPNEVATAGFSGRYGCGTTVVPDQFEPLVIKIPGREPTIEQIEASARARGWSLNDHGYWYAPGGGNYPREGMSYQRMAASFLNPVYVVLIEDRHSDSDVEIVDDEQYAISRARELAAKYSRGDLSRVEETLYPMLGLVITYSSEGDKVSVYKRYPNVRYDT